VDNRFDVRIVFTDKDGVKGVSKSGQIATSMSEAKRKAIITSNIPKDSKLESVVAIPVMHRTAP